MDFDKVAQRVLTRRIILFVAAAVIVASGYAIRATNPTPPARIVVGTFSKALGNAPYHVAKHFKWFEAEPALKDATISYQEFNDRPAIASAFSRGELDLLFSAEIPSILIRAQGEDVSLVLASTFAAQEVLVPASSQVKSVTDLRGKKVAVQAGTSSHFGLMHILENAGVNLGDVSLVLMPAAEGRAAFEAGSIDAWAVWAPWVETQEVQGRGRALSGGQAVIYSVGTMRKAFIRNHAAQGKALFEVIQRAKAWIIANPSEAQKIVSQELGFDLAVVERAWPKFDWSVRLSAQVIPDFQAKAAFLAAQKLTRENAVIDVAADLVDLSFERPTP